MRNRTSLRGDVVDPGGTPGNHTNVKKQVVRTRTQGPAAGTKSRDAQHNQGSDGFHHSGHPAP
jgi:hypothetical protein